MKVFQGNYFITPKFYPSFKKINNNLGNYFFRRRFAGSFYLQKGLAYPWMERAAHTLFPCRFMRQGAVFPAQL